MLTELLMVTEWQPSYNFKEARTIIGSPVELPIAVTTWVCAGEVLEVEEREKGLAGKEGQQSGEVSAS